MGAFGLAEVRAVVVGSCSREEGRGGHVGILGGIKGGYFAGQTDRQVTLRLNPRVLALHGV